MPSRVRSAGVSPRTVSNCRSCSWQRLDIAKAPQGVKEAFAIQAGREIRVIVDAKRVDDATAAKIARDVAKGIEEQMTYPGEIRVTVLREVRAVSMAR